MKFELLDINNCSKSFTSLYYRSKWKQEGLVGLYSLCLRLQWIEHVNNPQQILNISAGKRLTFGSAICLHLQSSNCYGSQSTDSQSTHLRAVSRNRTSKLDETVGLTRTFSNRIHRSKFIEFYSRRVNRHNRSVSVRSLIYDACNWSW